MAHLVGGVRLEMAAVYHRPRDVTRASDAEYFLMSYQSTPRDREDDEAPRTPRRPCLLFLRMAFVSQAAPELSSGARVTREAHEKAMRHTMTE